jgi:hypothetical protein
MIAKMKALGELGFESGFVKNGKDVDVRKVRIGVPPQIAVIGKTECSMGYIDTRQLRCVSFEDKL